MQNGGLRLGLQPALEIGATRLDGRIDVGSWTGAYAPDALSTRNRVRDGTNFVRRFKVESGVQIAAQKYFPFFFTEINALCRHPAPTRGAYRDRHDTRGGDAVDATGLLDERHRGGRQRRVVLISRR